MSRASNPNDGEERSLTVDKRHDLLSSRERRYLLYALSRFAAPLSLPRAAEYVTEWIHGTTAEEIPDERLNIYLRLYHNHVPRLAEAGVVVYHQEDDTLAAGPNATELESEIERPIEDGLPARHEQLFLDD